MHDCTFRSVTLSSMQLSIVGALATAWRTGISLMYMIKQPDFDRIVVWPMNGGRLEIL
jgi:hypothetical protein